ncbi:unnamed protein product (macronuclear) [Paramecium tetraurelia]|uniref:Uncharacterized protein n=1 Tax=Paramecium tetraurelia TaxID=5888 RepID=A0DWC4_PARTE|nr:uncharacterized protein GSPATT00020983001 [Paramecium tetraurelia]CAK87341.1 unnamed protein product [Paramecium tetraurelia]|eukprot:XP_001454738.1 hypothetical protein (macronuclear) [Paramecium tetraurelia strain d4-2]
MKSDNEITKTDRLISHLDQDQARFKIAGKASIKLDSQFPANSNFYGNVRTYHQTIFQKVGYSVSQDLNQQIAKASLVSTETQSVRKVTNHQIQQFFIPSGQSIEILNNNDQFVNKSESPYILQRNTKTFQNHQDSYENLNDHYESDSNDNTPRSLNSISILNKPISKNDIQTNQKMDIAKFKPIRSCFQVIRAVFRLKMLQKTSQKKQTWDLKIAAFKKNQMILHYNESITKIKIKQWTQMVFTKMISVIQQINLQKQQLNFIDCPDTMKPVEIDQAIIYIQNSFTFAMSNLLVMATSKNLLNELSLQMHQDQYFEYRKHFSKFVSQRANYITYHYPEMNEQEKQIVFSECIIINNLIPSFIKLTTSLDSLNCNKPSVEFLIKCMISLFQYFFVLQFSEYPIIEIKNQIIKYSQYHLGRKQSQLIIVQNQQLNSDDLIDGVYTEQQMQLILRKESWLQSNKKMMNVVTQNLAIIV